MSDSLSDVVMSSLVKSVEAELELADGVVTIDVH